MVQVYALNNDGVAALFIESDVANILGWSVTRTNVVTGDQVVLNNEISFAGQPEAAYYPSTVAPFQKNIIFDGGVPFGQYKYTVQAMGGSAGSVTAIAGTAAVSNVVVLDIQCTDQIWVAFTDGILADKWMAENCPKTTDGQYDLAALATAIATPGNLLRQKLMGNVMQVMQRPLLRAAANGGHAFALFYELTDPEWVAFLVEYFKALSIIVSNAGADNKENAPTIEKLKQVGADVLSRIVPPTSIGHNKTITEEDAQGNGVSWLGGSVNPTTTGLCTQSSNVILIEDQTVAEQEKGYWDLVQTDTEDDNSQQGPALRTADAVRKPLVTLKSGATVQMWNAPNTPETVKPKDNPATPPDMADEFALVDNTKALAICLQFIPGYPSLLSYIGQQAPNMLGVDFLCAVSDPAALPHEVPTLPADKAPLYVVASALSAAIGDLLKEFDILPNAHAIIHSKYYVSDPLSRLYMRLKSGSGNDGFKASYSNDETNVIISGEPRVGMYYMVDGLKVYCRYLENQQLNAGQGTGYLVADGSWQAQYQTGWMARVIAYVAANPYPAPPVTPVPAPAA